MLPPKRPLSRSDFRKWTGDEADRVIDFLERTNPDLLRRIEELERTTRDLSGSEGFELGRVLPKVFPEIANHDRTGLLVAVRRRIQAKVAP